VTRYLDTGRDDELDEKLEQVRAIEERADQLRRSIFNVMYNEMLMPDTRGDVVSLLGHVDATLDDCVHLIASLAIQRPAIPPEFTDGCKTLVGEVGKSIDAMLQGARAYFTEPRRVRDYVHKINFHEKEATTLGMRVGKAIFSSGLALENKRHLLDWVKRLRQAASRASDIGDQLFVFAIKRVI
jgi:predicted phosphate transport protein (TIGR00153 family)